MYKSCIWKNYRIYHGMWLLLIIIIFEVIQWQHLKRSLHVLKGMINDFRLSTSIKTNMYIVRYIKYNSWYRPITCWIHIADMEMNCWYINSILFSCQTFQNPYLCKRCNERHLLVEVGLYSFSFSIVIGL